MHHIKRDRPFSSGLSLSLKGDCPPSPFHYPVPVSKRGLSPFTLLLSCPCQQKGLSPFALYIYPLGCALAYTSRIRLAFRFTYS